MKLWQRWLGERVTELKLVETDTAYERIGQIIREQLREQEELDDTERLTLNNLEDKKPGKLGIFVGRVYRTYIKTKLEEEIP